MGRREQEGESDVGNSAETPKGRGDGDKRSNNSNRSKKDRTTEKNNHKR